MPQELSQSEQAHPVHFSIRGTYWTLEAAVEIKEILRAGSARAAKLACSPEYGRVRVVALQLTACPAAVAIAQPFATIIPRASDSNVWEDVV